MSAYTDMGMPGAGSGADVVDAYDRAVKDILRGFAQPADLDELFSTYRAMQRIEREARRG